MSIYIYVDDIREDDTWFRQNLDGSLWTPIVCRSYNQAIRVINEFYQDHYIILDLDHDLGDLDAENDGEYNPNAPSGYDICKYVVENHIPLIGFHIHSMNPVGAENMRQLLQRYGYEELY